MDCWNEQRIKSKRFCGICQNLGPRALFPRLIGTVVLRGRLHWLKFRIGFELELYPLVYFLHFEAARPLRCRKIKNRPHSDNYHTAQMAGSLADHSLNLDLVDAEGVDLLQAAATVRAPWRALQRRAAQWQRWGNQRAPSHGQGKRQPHLLFCTSPEFCRKGPLQPYSSIVLWSLMLPDNRRKVGHSPW